MKELSFKSVFTPFFLLIFAAMFASTFTDQYIALKVERLVSSPKGLSDTLWVWGTLSLLSAIFFPMLFAILCSYNIVKQPPSFADYFEENLELSMIESLRSWGKSFMWSLVFILPGIAKFILFTLTPYVVLFSRKYKEGAVDALQYSSLICKQNLKKVNLWLTVFYVGVPIALYFTVEPYRLLRDYPLAGTLIIFLKTLAEYGFHYMMLKIFLNYMNQTEFAESIPEIPAEVMVEYSEDMPESPAEETPEDNQEENSENGTVDESPEEVPVEVPEDGTKEER